MRRVREFLLDALLVVVGFCIGCCMWAIIAGAYFLAYYGLSFLAGHTQLKFLYLLCGVHLILWAYLTASWICRKRAYGFDSEYAGFADGFLEDWSKPFMVYIGIPHYAWLMKTFRGQCDFD